MRSDDARPGFSLRPDIRISNCTVRPTDFPYPDRESVCANLAKTNALVQLDESARADSRKEANWNKKYILRPVG
jgi:hypothetical protein